MIVRNPNANIGKLVSFKTNGKDKNTKVRTIRLLESSILLLYAQNIEIKFNLMERSGLLLEDNSQIIVEKIKYKIFRDKECTIFKVEWEIVLNQENFDSENYYLLVIFNNSRDFDSILRSTQLEVQALD